MALLRSLLGKKKVLVTGSAGYLGFALHLTLQQLGVSVIGVDVVPGTTVDVTADVADIEAMRRCGEGCSAVLHTAALHAPHALSWHAREFSATNVGGTKNILALGLPTVFTSTTSLTISSRVKARERAGELVWLDETSQRPDARATGGEGDAYDAALDAPRNKYGRTKLDAEQACLHAARTKAAEVVVLRAPRFFPEDVLEASSLSLANVKANELLGRRCALSDLVDAHVRALARIHRVRGAVLTIAAPWPLARRPGASSSHAAAAELRACYPHAERLFARHGWRLPEGVSRVYDSDAAVNALGWQPRVTFEALLRVMEAAEAAEAAEAEEGAVGEDSSAQNKRRRVASSSGLALEEVLEGKY